MKVTSLKHETNGTTHVHMMDDNLYYLEDDTGIYRLNGNGQDYVDYLLNRGWTIFNEVITPSPK